MSKNIDDCARLGVENAALRDRVAGLELEAQRFKATLYSIGDAVIATDAESVIVQMNPVAETLTGWSEADAIGRPAEEVFHIVNETTDAKVESPITRVLREGLVVGLANHTVLVARDGTRRPIADSGAPIRNEQGEIMGVVLVFRDQTAERLAQKGLEESEARFRTVFEGSPLGKSMTGIDGRLSVNQAFCELLGYSEEELATRKWQELTHPDDLEESARIVKSLLDGTIAHARYEKRYLHKSRKVIWTDVNTTLARDTEGNPLFFITTISDITERKRMEAELREATAYLENLIGYANAPIIVWDPLFRITRFNRAFEHLTGRLAGDVIGKALDILFPAEQVDQSMQLIEQAQSGERWETVEIDIRHVDGSIRTVLWNSATIYATDGKTAIATIAQGQDITEHKRADAIMKQEQALSDTIIDSIPGTFYMLDATGKYVRWNAYQRDEIVGKPDDMVASTDALDTIHPDDRELIQSRIANVLTNGADEMVEGRVLLRGGPAFRWLLMTGRRIFIDDQPYLIGIGVDITELKHAQQKRENLEDQLRASQKMEAIGSLAGGVAHDFNNLLSVILSYTGFAMESVPGNDPILADLVEVKKAGERAAMLTRQLLAFSRKQVLQPSVLDVNGVAAGLENMLRRILGEDVELVQVLDPELGLVMADQGQIEQVLMNLVVNARDAMPMGGNLTIETANVELDEEWVSRHVDLKAGSYVQISVSDTGCGMDEPTMARIFDTFFTTKEKGKGTGLGLAMVYGIVRQSEGSILVNSEPGRGTTFRIYLPRCSSTVARPAGVSLAVARRATGTETVLVVEDEEALRRVILRALVSAGYTVIMANDGDEALQICGRHTEELHLVLTDVVMPRMSGRVLAGELAKIRPTVKVVYMSGYTEDAISHHGILDPGTHFLAKPFTVTGLLQKVREVLDIGITQSAGER